MISGLSDDFEPWPEISRSQLIEFFIARFPDKPIVASIMSQAASQYIMNNKVAWEDLGVFDVQKQQELEAQLVDLINDFATKHTTRTHHE